MIKVERLVDEKTGIMRFAFETNTDGEVEVLDSLKTAILGTFPRQGGFVTGKRLIIEVNPGRVESLPTNAA